jgi:hypothetical protein
MLRNAVPENCASLNALKCIISNKLREIYPNTLVNETNRRIDRLLQGAGWNCSSILLLVAKGHQICIKCTNDNVRLRTPDDWQKGYPKHAES